MQVDLTECLPESLGVSFSKDVDVMVTVDPLLDDFRSNSVVFFLFPSISSCNEVSSRSIDYILDLFFLEHRLCKIDPFRPVLKAVELISLALAVLVVFSYLTDLDDLVEGKNIILAPVYISHLII